VWSVVMSSGMMVIGEGGSVRLPNWMQRNECAR
jgi:hypothetical protein